MGMFKLLFLRFLSKLGEMFSIDFIASKKSALVCLKDMSTVEKALIIIFSILLSSDAWL